MEDFQILSPIIKSGVSIRKIINHYSANEFREMKQKINLYGASIFFLDLWKFLEDQIWKDPLNRYTFYVGISLQYWKRYE